MLSPYLLAAPAPLLVVKRFLLHYIWGNYIWHRYCVLARLSYKKPQNRDDHYTKRSPTGYGPYA